jgi:hypothetical protein
MPLDRTPHTQVSLTCLLTKVVGSEGFIVANSLLHCQPRPGKCN